MSETAVFSPVDLQECLRRAKAGSRKFVTNFFVPPGQWSTWIERGLRLTFANEQILFLAWPEAGCTRLFFAGDRAAIGSALGDVSAATARPLVVDLLGRAGDAQEMAALFSPAGFRLHLRLFRLSCTTPLLPKQSETGSTPCEPAVSADVPAILELLRDNFDVYADQLPQPAAVQDAIAAGEISIVRSQDGIDGFVWFSKTGATASIRYWCVAQRARGRGVGSAVMRDYFDRMRDCARHLLWVRENNPTAAACYQHYGYRADGLEDHILLLDK